MSRLAWILKGMEVLKSFGDDSGTIYKNHTLFLFLFYNTYSDKVDSPGKYVL